jgi:hypothetical protein
MSMSFTTSDLVETLVRAGVRRLHGLPGDSLNGLGTNYFQETHLQELFRQCSVYRELVSIPEQFPFVLETAASQSPGTASTIPRDVSLAARNALLNMIDHLTGRGSTTQQGYAICSVAVDLKISQVVDVPNMLVSAFLPEDILTAWRHPAPP